MRRASINLTRLRGTCAAVCVAALLVPASAVHASVDSDKAQIQSLQKQIAAQGEHIQDLVARSNEAQTRKAKIDAEVADQQRVLDADRAAETNAAVTVQHLAVGAYMRSGTIDTAALDLFRPTHDVTQTLA